jgi:hypothetical protein
VYQESLMHYHEDSQYANDKKAKGSARLIVDQNKFITNESSVSIKYFQEDLNSIVKTLPASASRISKRQIELVFGLP